MDEVSISSGNIPFTIFKLQKIHRADPSISPQQIHEVQPVKFGGSPTDTANKAYLDRSLHQDVTNWWNDLQRYIQGVNR